MNIKGYYEIRSGDNCLKQDNIITLLGESFFLNRMLNNKFNPIEYVLLGNASNTPSKDDLSLGNETVRKRCVKKVDLERHVIELICSCEIHEIENTSEIGVSNGDILISHDIYELDEDFIDPSVDIVEIKYTFKIEV